MKRYTRRATLRRTALLLGVGLAGCREAADPTATDNETGTVAAVSETRSETPTESTATGTAGTDRTPSPTDSPTATEGQTSTDPGSTPRRVAPTQDGVAWRVDLGTGVHAAPAVADETVYVGGWRETQGTPTPDDDGQQASDLLFALDPAEGAVEWEATVGPVQRRPRVVGDTVYVVRGYNGLHGHDYQVRALTTDGDERWRHEAPSLKFLSVLGVDESGVAVGTHDDYLSGGEERVTALSPGGEVVWEKGFVDVHGGAVDSEAVSASAFENRIRAYDRETGSERWTFETVQKQPSDPVHAGETAVVASGNLYGIDRETGSERWSFERSDVSQFVVENGTVFTSFVDGSVRAFAANDGTVQWEQTVGSRDASLAVANGQLYVARDGTLLARDGATGDEQWRVDVGGSVRPVPAGERVYAHRTEDGSAVALAAGDGSRQRTFEFDGERSALVTRDGTDVVTTAAGRVYGLAR